MTHCPKCRRILQSGYCAVHGRIVPLPKRKSNAIGIPGRLHGTAFQSAFDKAFGLEPLIHPEQLGGSTPATLNTTATAIPSGNGSMLGAGQISASSPPTQNIIKSEAGATVFSTKHHHSPSCFGRYSSSIPIIGAVKAVVTPMHNIGKCTVNARKEYLITPTVSRNPV